MLLAGTLLILAGLSNLLITDKRATHDWVGDLKIKNPAGFP
jgi:hypothetical protein